MEDNRELKLLASDIINNDDAPKKPEEKTDHERTCTNYEEKEVRKQVYIFVSYDICDSTKMKSCVDNWDEIVTSLYKAEYHFKNMIPWKIVGDEILFYIPFSNIRDFINLIDVAYKMIGTLQNTLNSLIDKSIHFDVKIKGAMWLACFSNEGKCLNNLQIDTLNEFIGLQIDEGFRMSKFSAGGKLLLDPKIVFIILTLFSSNVSEDEFNHFHNFGDAFLKYFKEVAPDLFKSENATLKFPGMDDKERGKINEIIKKLFFVKYEKLKGVWNDSPYPIYWYFESNEDLEYFENGPIWILENQILVAKYPQNQQNQYFSKKLIKVFQTVGSEEEIKATFEIISQNHSFNTKFSRIGVAQFYYSIVCVKDGKVLIAKRSENRKHLRGVWDFGLRKHKDIDMSYDIKEYLKNEFGFKDVNIILDGSGEEGRNNFLPIHFCSAYRNNHKHNSILCCVQIEDETTVEELKENINEMLRQKPDENKLFTEVDFVDASEAARNYESLTVEETEKDSYNAQVGCQETYNSDERHCRKQKAIMYFADSIKASLSIVKQWKEWNCNEKGENKTPFWTYLFCNEK